jgi:2-polyprenyl-6-methoxyphenol hydroxylase-like FAD-dependent oxidoreductase
MTRVAIIGGGIGGLTTANALSRAGIEVAVYEAAAELAAPRPTPKVPSGLVRTAQSSYIRYGART